MSSKKIRVAVIDDEQDILDMIEKFLKRSGSFDVTTFINQSYECSFGDQ